MRDRAQCFLGSAGEELEIAHGACFATGNPYPRASCAKGAEVAYGVSRELVLPAHIERGLASTRSCDLPQQVRGHEAHLAMAQGDPDTGLIQGKSPSSSKTRARRGPDPGQCSTGDRQRPVRGAAIGRRRTMAHRLRDGLSGADGPGDAGMAHGPHRNPAPCTPGGVKGGGAAGTVGAYTAVANALLAMHVELPARPGSPQTVGALSNTRQAQAHATVTRRSQA
jgi:hypothetical protein